MVQNRQKFIDTLTVYRDARKTSVSDGTLYPAFCQYASQDAEILLDFRRDPIYTEILEHVSYDYGKQYLFYILMNDQVQFSKEQWNSFKINDAIGNPIMYDYSALLNQYAEIDGRHIFSPTTLRYIKVLQDIICLFDTTKFHSVSEIGIGYGGQSRIICDYFSGILSYKLIDLPEVINLAQVYLTAIEMCKQDNDYKVCKTGLEYIDGTHYFDEIHSDFVISNYAFSELEKSIQEIYLQKVILNAPSGYITWNDLSFRELDGFSIEELIDIIPGAKCIEEKPLSYINNQIIVWGYKNK